MWVNPRGVGVPPRTPELSGVKVANGRNEHGQFVAGHTIAGHNGGRPKRAVEEKYLDILRATVTPDDWKTITQTAIARAKAGDNVARQWLSDWMLGKPVERHELTGAEGEPIRVVLDQ